MNLKKSSIVILFLLSIAHLLYLQEENDPEELNEMLTAMAYDGGLEYIKALIADGADIDYIDRSGKSALHWAIEMDHLPVAEYLLKIGADPNIRDKENGYSPLHYVAKVKFKIEDHRLRIARFLLDRGADPNALDVSKSTPLHLAVYRGYTDLCKLLIAKGADVNSRTEYYNFTPLHEASKGGRSEIVRLLIKNGVDPDFKARNGWTPLHTADNVQVAIDLILAGAKLDVISQLGYTPASEAAEKGELDILQVLFVSGADIRAGITDRNRTLLHYAGNDKVAEYLVSIGFDVNATDSWGYTPLHTASAAGSAKVVEYLINNGANINAKIWHHITVTDYLSGSTPLDIALKENPNSTISALLISKKAKSGRGLPGNLYYEDFDSSEPQIFQAIRSGKYITVRSLIKSEENINQKDIFGWSPIHWSAQFGRIETVKLLLSAGAAINDVTTKKMSRNLDVGSTPLDIAIAAGKTDMINFLIDRGAKRGKDLTMLDRLLNFRMNSR